MPDIDASPEPVRCCRPTRTGKPCANEIRRRYDVACQVHSTEADRAAGEALRAARASGFSEGCAFGKAVGRTEVENERRLDQREAQRQAAWRSHTGEGHQIVCCGKYAYVWRGVEELRIGDRVLLPGNWLFQQQSEANVTALGTDYTGELASVVSLVKRAITAAGAGSGLNS